MAERDADAIQREIEAARVELASAVDQIAYRTNPKRVADGVKQSAVEKLQTPAGKAVVGGAGLVVVLLIVRRIRRR